MKTRPVIGITMGDMNGIGPEIAIKAALSSRVRKICIPVLIGSPEVFVYYGSLLRTKTIFREVVQPATQNSKQYLQYIDGLPFTVPDISPGTISEQAGKISGKMIEEAVALWHKGVIDGVVTSPVSKEAMKKGGYEFPGQTEMFAYLTNRDKFMMMLLTGNFRVGLATIHIPLKSVSDALSRELLSERLAILHESLKVDFGIRSPRIAVLGLNPHAGENGHIGGEEIAVIKPVLDKARRRGMLIEGCFPGDGFFGNHLYRKYDAVFAMYHDQGLIPLKMLGFERGVNVTAGLPIVRTSPDHGTAFDIAGTNCANPTSMIEAVCLSVEIVNNRKKKKK